MWGVMRAQKMSAAADADSTRLKLECKEHRQFAVQGELKKCMSQQSQLV